MHRRCFFDDKWGVDEALNEPGVDGRGLVVRGSHWLTIEPLAKNFNNFESFENDATSSLHRLDLEIFYRPVLSFSSLNIHNEFHTAVDKYRNNFATLVSVNI